MAKLQRFRLAPVYKWASIAPHVKSVLIRFDAAADGTVGIKEFWRQVVGPKVRSKFPSMEVKLKLTEGLEDPLTSVTFKNDVTVTVDAKNMTVDEMYTELYEHVSVFEMQAHIPGYEVPKLEDSEE